MYELLYLYILVNLFIHAYKYSVFMHLNNIQSMRNKLLKKMTIVKTNTFVKIYDSSQYNIQICNKKSPSEHS